MHQLSVVLLGVLSVSIALQADTSGGPARRDLAGGASATVYEYPFVVLLARESIPPRTCSGTLISDEWVLTAAHCVDGLRSGDDSFDSRLTIAHGFPLHTEVRHARVIRMHPEFDPLQPSADWEHDIALVCLSERFLSRTAVPVPLADPADGLFLLPGTMTRAVAWGGANPAAMTQTDWPLAACPETPALHLCTPTGGTAELEPGDAGGPLLVRRQEGWVQIGIHSFLSASDGVQRHVRVDGHREWIRESLEQPCVETRPCRDDEVPPGDSTTPPDGENSAQSICIPFGNLGYGLRIEYGTAPGELASWWRVGGERIVVPFFYAKDLSGEVFWVVKGSGTTSAALWAANPISRFAPNALGELAWIHFDPNGSELDDPEFIRFAGRSCEIRPYACEVDMGTSPELTCTPP